jgi:hypothetical protein
MKKIEIAVVISFAALLAGCNNDADVASANLSQAADNFRIERRIIFVNGITDRYLMTIEGLCSLGNNDKPRELTVTCKTGPDSYKKHFVEQIDSSNVNVYHYAVTFKPESIIPDIQVK